MRFVSEELKNNVIRLYGGEAYYFDQDGIYRCVSICQAERMKLPYHSCRGTFPYKEMGITHNNLVLIKIAIAKLKVGDTLEVLDEYLANVELEKHNRPEGIDRFITKINHPIFQRNPGTLKRELFDYIYVEVNIISHWEEDIKTYIKKNLKEIVKRVLEKVEASKSFPKYGISVNCLKVSSITLRQYGVLEVVLKPKI